MHQIFQRGGPFAATKQGGRANITIDIHSCGDFSQVSGIGDLLRERPGSQRIKPNIIGRYFKPQRCNLPSVDSFAVTECAAAGGEVLVLFQMTVSTEHPVKAEGLASIWAVIPQALRRAPPYSFLSFRPMSQARLLSRGKVFRARRTKHRGAHARPETTPISKRGNNTFCRSATKHCGKIL